MDPVRFQATSSEARHFLTIDLASQTGTYFKLPIEPKQEEPFENRTVKLDGLELPNSDELKKQAWHMLEELGAGDLKEESVSLRSGPEVSFDVVANDSAYRTRYDLGRKRLDTEPVEEAESMPWRSYLTRLHVAHTYPSDGGVRWIWAILVDVMAFSMVSWGVTGLLMWWQIKKTRSIGKWLVFLSILGALFIGLGMHGDFTH